MRSPMFTVALLIALAIVTLWWQLAEKRARKADAELARSRVRLEALVDSLGRAGSRTPNPSVLIPDEAEIDRLRHETGLSNPVHALLVDLARHPELIPFPGIEGGTMFFDTTSIAFLPESRARVGFEDGHIVGHALLEYHVANGHITWKRIAAQLD